MESATSQKDPNGAIEEKRLLSSRSVSNIIADIVIGLDKLTTRDALEAASQLLGDKLLDMKDAAAIESALGIGSQTKRGSFAAQAQSAAAVNRSKASSRKGITLQKLLKDAQACLPDERPVTKRVGRKVEEAERRNKPAGTIHPTGVAACTKAAAMLNGDTYDTECYYSDEYCYTDDSDGYCCSD